MPGFDRSRRYSKLFGSPSMVGIRPVGLARSPRRCGPAPEGQPDTLSWSVAPHCPYRAWDAPQTPSQLINQGRMHHSQPLRAFIPATEASLRHRDRPRVRRQAAGDGLYRVPEGHRPGPDGGIEHTASWIDCGTIFALVWLLDEGVGGTAPKSDRYPKNHFLTP